MDREIFQFVDKEAIANFWNKLYHIGNSTNYGGEIYTTVDIVYRRNCDGECGDWIIKRESDGKYFKIDWWEGGNDGYEFHGNKIIEVFPKQVISVTYE